MHFSTESRVHAADMLTDAENAGAPLRYTCPSPPRRGEKNTSETAVNFRARGEKKNDWMAALIYRVSARFLNRVT